ncbi:hypothetical protein ACH5RR_003322 [Cinchona calisaya]|uniref:Uncharacterized protein n=1 Tax=Cinchona calisaya TaxID=153742 RepID=A0ABD3AUU7_9GENT
MGQSCATPRKQKDKGKGKQFQVQQVYQRKSSTQLQVNNSNHATVEKLQIVASSLSTKKNNPIHEEEEAQVPTVNPIQAEASSSPVAGVEISAEEAERNKAQIGVQMQHVLLVFNERYQISNLNEVAQESMEKVGASNVSNSRDDSNLRQEVSTQE